MSVTFKLNVEFIYSTGPSYIDYSQLYIPVSRQPRDSSIPHLQM